MEYNILIETDFFNLLNAGHKNKGGNALENSWLSRNLVGIRI